MEKIEIIKPDDWHVHFRDNEILKAVVPETARHFERAIVMPNLTPPILTGSDALQYRKRIIAAAYNSDTFIPLMTVYLTESINIEELEKSYKNKIIFGAKLYPAAATTNSDLGIKNINKIIPILEKMADIGMPLLVHGESTDKNIDIFDREKIFIDNILDNICKRIPELKITLEHITTKDAVSYIEEANNNIVASITPHHLALNRNAMLVGGIRPHYYCLPVLKRETHRQALIKAATSGNKKFFLGSDTAPHTAKNKEAACGCAGVFNATYCISILAQIFEDNNSISKLERFTSFNGANHYQTSINKNTITIIKKETPIKFLDALRLENNENIVIFKPDFPVFWEVVS